MKSIGFGLERVAWLALKAPRTAAAILLAILALGTFGLTRVTFDQDLRNALASNDEAFQRYTQATAEFVDPENEMLALVEGDNLTDPAVLQKLQDFQFELQLADGVDSVYSLFALRRPPDANGDAPLLVNDPSRGLPPDLINQIRAYPIFGSQLVSPDGKAMLFTITPSVERALPAVERKLMNEIEKTAAEVLGPDGPKVTVTGFSAIRVSVLDILQRDQIVLNAAGALVGFLMSFVVFRSLTAALIVAIPSVAGGLLVIGFMGLLGLPVNVMSPVVPALVMILGYTDGMQLCFAWRRYRNSGMSVREAEERAQRDVAGAVLLAAMTTAIGFMSLVISRVVMVRTFGLTGAIGTIGGAFVVVVTHGLLTNAIGHRWKTTGTSAQSILTWLEGPSRRIGTAVLRFARPISILSTILFVVLGFMHLSVPPQHSIRENLPADSPANAALTRIDAQFGGSLPIQVVVPLHGDAPYSPAGLARIGSVHKAMAEFPELKAPLSLWSVVEWLGGSADEATAKKIETFETTISEQTVRHFYNGKDAALVTAYIPSLPTHRINDLVDRVEAAVHAAAGNDVFVTGVTVINARAGGSTIDDLKISLLLSVVGNLGIIALAFLNISFGALSFLPNVLPLFATGSFLYITGRGMQFTSVIALTVAFGIAVNSAVHFLNRFRLPQNVALPFEERLVATCTQIGPVLFGTTLIIVAGLSTTLTSGLPSLLTFGWIAALTLTVALIGDLVILPSLIAGYARRWFETKSPPLVAATKEKAA